MKGIITERAAQRLGFNRKALLSAAGLVAVLDKTGLMGNYDFTLQWTPEEGETAVFNGPKGSQLRADSTPLESSGPSIFAAIQEQLGLKLESQKGPVQILVIDHVEKKPSDN